MKDFILNNAKMILVAGGFLMTLYVQHVMNVRRLEELDVRCTNLETRFEEQYKHMDLIKLDKSVFEATMSQFFSMREDIREIQRDLKELLKKSK